MNAYRPFLMLLLCLILIPGALAALTDGLFAYYSFDLDAREDYHKIHNGTAINATHITTGTALGTGAYNFDGNNDFINISNFGTYGSSLNQSSVNVWVKYSDSVGTSVITGVQSHAGFRWRLDVEFQNYIARENTQTNSDDFDQRYSVTSYNNRWHMLTFVNMSNGGAKLYQDGVEVSISATSNPGLSSYADFQNNLFIGAEAGSGQTSVNDFTGDIDEIGYWNRTLTAAEVLELWDNGTGHNPITNEIGGVTFDNYITAAGVDYVRELEYTIEYERCPANYSVLRYIDGTNDLNHSFSCNDSAEYKIDYTYTHTTAGNYDINFTIQYQGGTENYTTIAENFTSDLVAPVIQTIILNATNGFNKNVVTSRFNCTDDAAAVVFINLTLNNASLYYGNKTAGVQITNNSQMNQTNVLAGSCTDLFNTTTDTYTLIANFETINLIDERTGAAFTPITNLSVVKLYNDDNSTSYDFRAAGKTSVNFTQIGNDTKLRLELITINDDVVIRYVDVNLINETIRLCVNKDDIVHYEQLIVSSGINPVVVKSVFANCIIAADYTRFAYQDAYALKAYSINTMYYLYTWDSDGNQNYLASLDGSIQSYINLDIIEFAQNVYNIGITQDALTFKKTGATTMTIYYNNSANDNTALNLAIKRLDTDSVVFNSSSFSNPNGFSMLFDYTTHANVTNETLYQAILTKTNGAGDTTIKRYFNTNARQGWINAGVAVIVALLLTIFGLTFTTARDSMGWFGILVVLGAFIVLAAATPAWYVTFMMTIEAIIGIFIGIMLITKNYPTIS